MATEGKKAGGIARAKKLTPERRREIAHMGAEARHRQVPEVISGSVDRPLRIGDIEIECYVLDDGTRVLTQASMLEALGRNRRLKGAGTADEGVPPVLQGKVIREFVSAELMKEAWPVAFRMPGSGTRALGYKAEALPAICEVYLAARDHGVLPPNQQRIAQQAEILVRGLARVGIIALVDEATGYQDRRAKDALAKILEGFVAKEIQPWVRTFPVEFYREMFRLRGLDFDPGSVKRPAYFGHLTNDVVYKRLAPGVLDEMKRQQSKDDKKVRLHQRLTQEIGHPKLREHLAVVVALMELSADWYDFKAKLDIVKPMYGETMDPLWGDDQGVGL